MQLTYVRKSGDWRVFRDEHGVEHAFDYMTTDEEILGYGERRCVHCRRPYLGLPGIRTCPRRACRLHEAERYDDYDPCA